ncbi:hypothetical protein ACHQM5_025346 [Ranunculus cassubicifolius]
MTEPISSSSETPLEYTTPALGVMKIGLKLNVPEDILELVNQFVKWKTLDDLERDRLRYIYARYEDVHNFDIGKELDMLKGLSSALGRQHDICLKECSEIEMKYEDFFHKLVEQVPHIKDIPGYELLTTESEKFQIEKALEKKAQNVKLQVVDPALVILLEVNLWKSIGTIFYFFITTFLRLFIFLLKDLRNKLMPIENKCGEVTERLGSIGRLLSTANSYIRILEAIVENSRFEEEMRLLEVAVDKEKTPKNRIRESQKLVERERVEEGLLKVLKEVTGKTLDSNDLPDSNEFWKRWWSMWDDAVSSFTVLLDDLSSG